MPGPAEQMMRPAAGAGRSYSCCSCDRLIDSSLVLGVASIDAGDAECFPASFWPLAARELRFAQRIPTRIFTLIDPCTVEPRWLPASFSALDPPSKSEPEPWPGSLGVVGVVVVVSRAGFHEDRFLWVRWLLVIGAMGPSFTA